MFISLTQGLQFIGLTLFPAITLSFILNFTTVVVIFLSIPLLAEFPNFKQSILIIIALVGGIIYFYPFNFLDITGLGVLVLVLILLSNASSTLIGRRINKAQKFTPIVASPFCNPHRL